MAYIQGLKTQEQQAIAKAFVDSEADAARALLLGEWRMPPSQDGSVPSQAAIEAATNNQKNNNFIYGPLASWSGQYDSAYLKANPQFVDKKIEELKEQSYKAMVDGAEPKGMGEILGDTFERFGGNVQSRIQGAMDNFDIWKPGQSIMAFPNAIMQSIWGAISDFIKQMALSFLGDQYAPQMMMVKRNYLDQLGNFITGKPRTEIKLEEANEALHYQNAGKALKKHLYTPSDGKKFTHEELENFGHAIEYKFTEIRKMGIEKYREQQDAERKRDVKTPTPDQLVARTPMPGVSTDGQDLPNTGAPNGGAPTATPVAQQQKQQKNGNAPATRVNPTQVQPSF